MTIVEDRLALLDTLKLDSGAHGSWEEGACILEAVSFVAGEPWTDHPKCASPVIGAFLRSWNDSLDDDTRQMLKPYITRLVGTKGTKAEENQRAWMATDWLARECAPAFLRCAGLTEHAKTLEGLATLDGARAAKKAQPALDAARKDSAAAWDAAGDAAWAAAWDAARAAARDAARDAARAAAWDAAWDAAWAAARDAAGDAAWDAAWDAARAAAGAALAPTVKTLQTSALLLLDRMIAVTEARS